MAVKGQAEIKTFAELVTLGRADMVSFSRWPLAYTGKYDLWDVQIEWQELFQKFWTEYRADPVHKQWLCILGPSEHGKTYGLNIPAILWVLANNRNLRVGICASKESKAQKIGIAIDRLWKAKKKELAEFGLIQDYPWNSEEKCVQRDDDKLIGSSMSFFGPESDIQGDRFDLLLCVDLFTKKNQRSPEARAKLWDWFSEVVDHRLEDDGFVMADGHHVHNEDQYVKMAEDKEGWVVKTWKAIIEEASEENDHKGKVLVPHKWSYEKLCKKRRRTPVAFELMFQNNPIGHSAIMDRAIFDASLDRSKIFRKSVSPDLKMMYDRIVLMHDPAFSVTRRAAHAVTSVVGVNGDDPESAHWELLGGWRDKMLPPQLKRRLATSFFMMCPDDIYIEANVAQILLVHDMKEMAGIYAERIRPVYTNNWGDEASIIEAVGQIVIMIEQGRFRIPYMGVEAREFADQLFLEIKAFPKKPNDIIMSLVIGYIGMFRKMQQAGQVIKQTKSLTEQVSHQVHPNRGLIEAGRVNTIGIELLRQRGIDVTNGIR